MSFVLVYLKSAPLQSAHADAFGLTRLKANRRLHGLLTALQAALATSGDLPVRTVVTLRDRLDAVTTARAVTADGEALAPSLFYDSAACAIPRPTDAGNRGDCSTWLI